MKHLREYFDGAKGLGVLATADISGKVDAAIYSSAPTFRRKRLWPLS